MTSFGADKNLTELGYTTTYKIQGQVYHLLGSLLPSADQQHKFMQIYFIGNEASEVIHRVNNTNGSLNSEVVRDLQRLLHAHHENVWIFKRLLDILDSSTNRKVIINPDKRPRGEHARHFNAPADVDVAVLGAAGGAG